MLAPRRPTDVNILKSACESLCIHDPPGPCDLIFVLAGKAERKPYGLELFRQGLAPRLILSIGRFEVRSTAALLAMPGLLTLRDSVPPRERHFWMDFSSSGDKNISLARLQKANTFRELQGLAEYLRDATIARMAIVSTSIHLRRTRYCTSKIPFFSGITLSFISVPEQASSFKSQGWWKRRADAGYVLSEYMKLAAYRLRY